MQHSVIFFNLKEDPWWKKILRSFKEKPVKEDDIEELYNVFVYETLVYPPNNPPKHIHFF